ncbi:MAG TPA: TorF family putative porin [Tahibacter sp.]|uniref:TorF family putative porin n=1 Tax=Tahibacter sp. TaxID=2056211 RepID=UPI002BD7FF45|nr:TorF family putative porin [Tahibacter sp.]HSX62515.1 TorF family putative porin [Tahibacter sp.]
MIRRPTRSDALRFLAPLASSLCALAAGAATAADFSGTLTATSDYVLRGVSQTQGDPAAQLGARLAFESGFYAALWGSQVDFGPALGTDAEIDASLGFNRNLGERWNLDLNLTRYLYTGTRGDANLDYNEVIATLTLDQRWWGLVAWSEDVFASGRRGVYSELGAKFPLDERWRLETIAAYYDLDDAYEDSYTRAQFSAICRVGAVDLRASAHWTSSAAERLFPGGGDSRAEVAATWSF